MEYLQYWICMYARVCVHVHMCAHGRHVLVLFLRIALKFFAFIYFVHVYTCGEAQAGHRTHVGVRGRGHDVVLVFHMWAMGAELRSAGLVVDAFPH